MRTRMARSGVPCGMHRGVPSDAKSYTACVCAANATMALQLLNPKAEGTSQKQHALIFNINAAKGLQEVLRSNLGPKGTIKMCASRFAALFVAYSSVIGSWVAQVILS